MKLGKGLKTVAAAVVFAITAAAAGFAADPAWAITLAEIISDRNEYDLRIWLGSWRDQVKNGSVNGEPVLMTAVERSWPAGVRMLLDAGCDPAARGTDDQTALIRAAQKNADPEIIRLILAKTPSVRDAQDSRGYSALMYAVGNGSDGVLSALLDRGVEVNSVTKNGTTALMLAISAGNEDAVKKLLKQSGIDVAKKNQDGETAFSFALTSRREGIILPIMQTGKVDFTQEIGSGNAALPPLLYAMQQNFSTNLVGEMITAISYDTRSDINDMTDFRGRDAWYFASNNRRYESVKKQLRDAGINRANADGTQKW